MEKGMYARLDRLMKEKHHDAYRLDKKMSEPTTCGGCGAVFSRGRWTWQVGEPNASEATCPACRRIADRFPAGILEIKGDYPSNHDTDIRNLIRNEGEKESVQHPLERIMDVFNESGSLVVTTTGVHMARRIGEALKRAYEGELSLHYGKGEQSVHVTWER